MQVEIDYASEEAKFRARLAAGLVFKRPVLPVVDRALLNAPIQPAPIPKPQKIRIIWQQCHPLAVRLYNNPIGPRLPRRVGRNLAKGPVIYTHRIGPTKPPGTDHLIMKERADLIIKHIANLYGLSYSDLLKRSKKYDVARPRHIAAYCVKVGMGLSYPKTGKLFDGRDHATILNSVREATWMINNGFVLDPLDDPYIAGLIAKPKAA